MKKTLEKTWNFLDEKEWEPCLPDIRSDIYFEIVGPTAFLSVKTDGFREVWTLLYDCF